ncbi:MAG: Fe(3+) ABC transporter substrate-binding protein [Cyanobacteria bacterium P01_D01_bin.128]
MNINRRLLLGTGAAAAATALGQLRPKRAQAEIRSKQSGSVVNLYTSRHYDTDEELYNSFERITGISINRIEAGADELIERIKAEGDNSPADILMTVDAGRLWRADQEGIFTPVSSSTLEEKIPSYLSHPEGHWFGFSKRARVIMYNKDVVDPSELSTYEALVDSQWQGRILIRSSSNIYNLSLAGSLIEAHGVPETEAWATGMVENMAREPEGNDTAQIRAAAAGLGDIAIANTYYLARIMKSDAEEDQEVADKMRVFFPNQEGRGTHVNISGAGVVASSPRKEAAIQFLEYLASPIAQVFFAQGNNEYPVVEGTALDPVVASFGSFKEDTVSASVFGENNSEALQMYDRAGWQ